MTNEEVLKAADELQDWFDTIDAKENGLPDQGITVVASIMSWMQAVDVDGVTIWCSEHDSIDEEAGEVFGLEYLKEKWRQHVKRLMVLTPGNVT
ncbi:MAG: hypothetical protein B7Z37_25020 [Verrucomicrobia bacterium 12-59-8]|nr:MAG: hypothetical protein B7Z37_25020 [Verrucomicrobia bacterium 12-59-8]